MERYAKHEKKSWKKDEWYLNALLLPAFGQRKAHEVRRRDVLALLEEAKTQRGPVLANRTLALVRKIYNWGIEQDLIEMNPCQQVKRVAQETESNRVLTDAELRAIWVALDRQDLASASLYKLELLTAQRGQEVRTMRWRDLDLDGGWWTIPAEFTKNELSHRVPLTTPAVAIMEALKATSNASDWVFPSSRATDMPISGARTALEDVRRLSEVDFRPHDFRRTAASLMTGLGIPRFVVSRVLNHVETGVTRVYDRHSYDSEKRQALETWSKRLTAIVGGDTLRG